jgi:hypothetical protein
MGAWVVVSTLGAAALAQAQEPARPKPLEEISAPRKDVYSVYTDAFYDPKALARPVAESDPARPWRLGPAFRVYAGADVIHYYRTEPTNKVLVRTTNNLFDTDPITDVTPNPNQLSATPGTPLFPDAFSGALSPTQRPGNVNEPGLRLNVPANVRLFPNEILQQTDDFDFGGREGYRPKIGIELPSGSRIEFRYFYVRDFNASPLIQDARNAAFFTRFISDDAFFSFQRFGYLNAPFLLPVELDAMDLPTDLRFLGEQRRNSPIGGLIPHNPGNENPSPIDPLFSGLFGAGPIPGTDVFSDDVPREPTNTDPFVLGLTDNRYFLSLLFTDGELAIARYSFDIQGGDLTYSRPIRRFEGRAWDLRLLLSVRYLALDEAFDFFFADTVFDRAQVNDPLLVPLPTPPGGGPLVVLQQPQRVEETQATYVAEIDNDIVGPQIGLDARLPFLSVFEFDLVGKAGFMANFLQNHSRFYRPDGVTLFDFRKNETGTSGVIEGSLGVNFHPHRNVVIRGGWEFMWLINVGTAIGNISFELDQRPRPKNDDSVLFHGWFAGAEVIF